MSHALADVDIACAHRSLGYYGSTVVNGVPITPLLATPNMHPDARLLRLRIVLLATLGNPPAGLGVYVRVYEYIQ